MSCVRSAKPPDKTCSTDATRKRPGKVWNRFGRWGPGRGSGVQDRFPLGEPRSGQARKRPMFSAAAVSATEQPRPSDLRAVSVQPETIRQSVTSQPRSRAPRTHSPNMRAARHRKPRGLAYGQAVHTALVSASPAESELSPPPADQAYEGAEASKDGWQRRDNSHPR